MGNECEIEIRDNPPKVESVLMDIESEEFPQQFKRIITTVDNRAIIDAYKRGIDVSNYAIVSNGKHVKLKNKKSKKRK